MGYEEQFFYMIPDFLDESTGGHWNDLPITHPLRMTQLFLMIFSVVVVPLVYLKIFLFIRNMKPAGLSERAVMRRKKRNIVSTRYNFAVWLADGAAIVMVSSP